MQKVKATLLIVGLALFLNAFSVMGPHFGYRLVSLLGVSQVQTQSAPPCLFGQCDRPTGVSYIGSGLIQTPQAQVGSQGLSQYFNSLAGGALGVAAF